MDLDKILFDVPLKVTLSEQSLGAFQYMGEDCIEKRSLYYEKPTNRLYLVDVKEVSYVSGHIN